MINKNTFLQSTGRLGLVSTGRLGLVCYKQDNNIVTCWLKVSRKKSVNAFVKYWRAVRITLNNKNIQ